MWGGLYCARFLTGVQGSCWRKLDLEVNSRNSIRLPWGYSATLWVTRNDQLQEVWPVARCCLKNFIDENKRASLCYVCLLNVDLVLNLPEVTMWLMNGNIFSLPYIGRWEIDPSCPRKRSVAVTGVLWDSIHNLWKFCKETPGAGSDVLLA